jgi:HSP20 family protein
MNTTYYSAAECAIPGTTAATVKPRFHVENSAEAYTVSIDLPGVPKSGITVELEKGVLSIKGTGRPAAPESWRPVHQELAAADYALRLRLEAPVNEEQIQASHEHGVLTLVLPVPEQAKARRIELN